MVLGFSKTWNGISYIPDNTIFETITVVVCTKSIGGYNSVSAYSYILDPKTVDHLKIAHIEAINVVVAVKTFMSEKYKAKTLLVQCDNEPTVLVFTNNRGKDPILLECARQLWRIQAESSCDIKYTHIKGKLNSFADALSRQFRSAHMTDVVEEQMKLLKLEWVIPDISFFSLFNRPYFRDAIEHGKRKKSQVKGARHMGEPIRSKGKIPEVL